MLKLRITGLNQASSALKRIYRGGVTLANREAALEVSHHIRDAVQQTYIMGSHAPHATGTRQVYSQGKYGYSGPRIWNRARAKHPGAKPYSRTGRLANSVIVTPLKNGYRIQIDPNARYSGADPADRGMPLWHIAARLEYPRPVAVPLTMRLLAYLQVLARGTAGSRKSKRGRMPDVNLGKFVVVRPRARPVWQKVYKQISRFRGPYWRALQQRLRLILQGPAASGPSPLEPYLSTRYKP